jgi:HK97 family phage portal protein
MLGNLFESRAISFQTLWGSGSDIEILNQSGTVINNKTSFEIVAFFSAVSLISDTISTLPMGAYRRELGQRVYLNNRPAWIDQPDVDSSRAAHYQQVLVSLMTSGNSYTRVFRNNSGEVVNLVVLDPNKVMVSRSAIGRKIFTYEGEQNGLTSDDIIHLTDLLEPGAIKGISRVEKLKEALGVASALQSYAARFFGQGATTQGIIEYPGNLLPDQAKQLRDGFDSAHKGFRKSHRTGILTGGATYKTTSVNNDSAQFLESRRFAVEEIARAFNIPLSFMGIPGTQSYASVEQNAIQFVTHCLRPYIEKIEWSYSRLLNPGEFIKFNVDGLMRGDFNSRTTAYNSALLTGWLSVDDVRRYEDLPPVQGGNVYRVPLANVDLAAAGLVEQQQRVIMAKTLTDAGFDPADVLAKLGLPEIIHTGLPSTQLQSVAQINPEDPESVY